MFYFEKSAMHSTYSTLISLLKEKLGKLYSKHILNYAL